MLPWPVVTGILLGCTASITIGLGVVLFLFAPNIGKRPQNRAVFPTAAGRERRDVCGSDRDLWAQFHPFDPVARLALVRPGGHVVRARLRVLLRLAGLIEDLVDGGRIEWGHYFT